MEPLCGPGVLGGCESAWADAVAEFVAGHPSVRSRLAAGAAVGDPRAAAVLEATRSHAEGITRRAIVSAIGAALSENVEPRGGNGGVNNGCAGGSVNGNGGNAGTAKRKADAVALEGQEDLMARRRFISASTMF